MNPGIVEVRFGNNATHKSPPHRGGNGGHPEQSGDVIAADMLHGLCPCRRFIERFKQ